MTDFEYILQQVKLFHYKGWEEGELQKCLGMLPTLSREDLVKLYRSKWINEKSKFRQSIFDILFKETVGKREERIKNLEIDALIEEFKDKKSGNVALIRKELRERYKANKDRMKEIKKMKKLIASLVAIMILVCGCTAAFADQNSVTREEAIQIALERVGLKEEAVTFTKIELDRDDGRQIWEIEFISAGVEYDFDIDARTGNILVRLVCRIQSHNSDLIG